MYSILLDWRRYRSGRASKPSKECEHMSTGRRNQLTKQVGEYLVASELARRGFMVATFSGNVPDFDIIATDFKGDSCPVQVKAARRGSWQFSINKFVDITLVLMERDKSSERKSP